MIASGKGSVAWCAAARESYSARLQPSLVAEKLRFVKVGGGDFRRGGSRFMAPVKSMEAAVTISEKKIPEVSTHGNSTNILWHDCNVSKTDRQQLLQQKGCVIWITGLSGSGAHNIYGMIVQWYK